MVVETTSGKLRGRVRRGVLAFRGIPYAAPPLGKLRWRAPEPPKPWAGVRDALAPGPGAPQALSRFGRVFSWIAGPTRTSEDCLTLDVFTPGADTTRRPVLVWIHGGAFVLGAGSAPVYAGERLARRGDVVVVTLNYRLGALGFLALGEVAPGAGFAENRGLRDQIAALEWVRDNIAAFGGDPANVTLVGESAGGMSVGALLGSPRARGLFARAIAQSGAASNCSSRDEAAQVARGFLGVLGLDSRDAARLSELPIERLIAAQLELRRLALALSGLPYQPVVDGDLLPVPPLDAIRAGNARGVDLLVGTNRDEWNLFLLADPGARALGEADLRRRLRAGLEPDSAERIHTLYRGALPDHSPWARWSAYQTHRIFLAPAERLAAAQARHAPTWSYLFSWSSPLVRRRLGACHALEVPLLFGTFEHPLLRALYLGGGRAAARELQAAWLGFARDGRPAPAADWLPAPGPPRRLCADDRGAWSAFERVRAAFPEPASRSPS
jgi:para-nitrobenzyl esterase